MRVKVTMSAPASTEVPAYISLYLYISLYIALYLPISPYFSLYLPNQVGASLDRGAAQLFLRFGSGLGSGLANTNPNPNPNPTES